MELNFTTFLLELVNFLILVWILKRLFYAPLKAAVEARKLEIKKSIDEAADAKAAAEALRKQVEGRLQEWSREKDTRLEELKREIDQERTKLLNAVRAEVTSERERLKAQDQAQRDEEKAKQEEEAIGQSLTFLSKLLTSFASPEVETAIVRSFLKQTPSLEPPVGAGAGKAVVSTAYPLGEQERAAVLSSLTRVLGPGTGTTFNVDPSLLAGIEVVDGAVVLRANLRDELRFFSTGANHG